MIPKVIRDGKVAVRMRNPNVLTIKIKTHVIRSPLGGRRFCAISKVKLPGQGLFDALAFADTRSAARHAAQALVLANLSTAIGVRP